MKEKRLAGQVAVVTGGGQGIGRTNSLLLAEQGAKVVVADFGKGSGGAPSSAEAVVAEIKASGGEAVAVIDDISQVPGAQKVAHAAIDAFGALHILINNAGTRGANPVDQLTEAQWDSVLNSHLKGSFLMSKFCVPLLRKAGGGSIVNTGSEAGLGMIFNSAYASAKEGLVGFTRSIAREQGRFGIRCNLVRPRANVGTGGGDWSREVFPKWNALNQALGKHAVGERGKSPLGKATLAEQVSTLVVWLCSSAAANVNGRSFFVGGEEVGLWSEPELVRSMTRPGSWTLDALDEYAPATMTGHLTNHFLVEDPLKNGD